MWTQEMRDKAAATRLITKQKKEARERKREENNAGVNGNGDRRVIYPEVTTESLPDASVHTGRVSEREEEVNFDWETAPLNEIITRQADMRREYERISQIVLHRQNPPRQRWTCFTQENIGLVKKTFDPSNARAILAMCSKSGEDGRANFRDDGRFVIENGVRRLKPAFCCNSTCYKAYQQLSRNPEAR
jgi:hypothetical protein